MNKILWVMVLFLVPGAFAQREWVVPKLHEISWKQTIGSGKVKLSTAETALLQRASRQVIAACVKDPGPWDPKTAKGLFEHLRVGRVEIAPDGEKALLVQGNGVCMCGAVGACPFWLISSEGQPLVLLATGILRSTAGINSFEFVRSETNGYFDLVLGSNDSAMEKFLQRFRFDGVEYKREGCALLEFDDVLGRAYLKPKITPTSCG